MPEWRSRQQVADGMAYGFGSGAVGLVERAARVVVALADADFRLTASTSP
ncbi:hypothetical protein [Streptomyces chartreusis]